VGVVGHSLRGATAAEACRGDVRIGACVDLDGSVYPEAQTSGFARPFLWVEAGREGRAGAADEARSRTMDAFIARLSGPACRVHVTGARHLDFIDAPAVSPALPLLVPGVGWEGADTLRATNALVAACLDAAVRGDRAAWARVRASRPRFATACARLPSD
jgi:hypothetical protein